MKDKKIKVLLGLVILVLGLVFTLQAVQKNQENRSKATDGPNPVGGFCGPANGVGTPVRPIEGLCNGSLPIWTDSVAEDGSFNWFCADANDTMLAECSADLQ
jgi:hypothetical protein